MIPHLPIPARLRIYLRFVVYLLWEFRWALGIFAALVLIGGSILHAFYNNNHEALSLARACHVVFLMIFLESSIDFPEEWFLQPLFFLIPIVGLGAVADSVIRLAFLMFSRKQNQPEWNRMLASLCRDHVVVVGIGRIGYQIVKELLDLKATVVAIESASDAFLLGELYDRKIPVIQGNARLSTILEQAGVAVAKAVIVTTSDDLTNLDVALSVRDLNPNARIVLRLFDETLASKMAGPFGMEVISTSQVAAPAFIAAATGRKVYQGFQLSGQFVHLTDMTICAEGRLVGRTIAELQSDMRVNVVMHQGRHGVNVNPGDHASLEAGDTILVIAPMNPLLELEAANHPEVQSHANHAQSGSRRPATR